ncbi:hypothetical protein fugu_014809 [Takifugu bimaculatus]|uniref:Uncharacterized protein n=1 Tax=Takifugu bimaculatus TaxID=433685 RepID=A0A4Z2C2C3_9TELE|nr:hypothetical protein fugu_014809 [Takifugu bimaculatus]
MVPEPSAGRNVFFLILNAPLLIFIGSFSGPGADSRRHSFVRSFVRSRRVCPGEPSLQNSAEERAAQALMFPRLQRPQVTAPLSPCSLHRTPLHACCHPEGRCITLGRLRNSGPHTTPATRTTPASSARPWPPAALWVSGRTPDPDSPGCPSESTAPSQTHTLLFNSEEQMIAGNNKKAQIVTL